MSGPRFQVLAGGAAAARGRISARRPARTSTLDDVRAVFASPTLYELAAAVPVQRSVGRRRQHPAWLLLGYGVLARVYRSAVQVQTELTEPSVWEAVTTTAAMMRAELGADVVPPEGPRPPDIDAWRYLRDKYLTDLHLLDELLEIFTGSAVAQARAAGLLDSAGPGSLCHPDASRCVYGDGTVVRPLYRPPTARREPDPKTGRTRVVYLDAASNETGRPGRRFDPDAADHHGHTGPVHGSNFVALSVRGHTPGSRVVLAVAAVPRPGQEAATAVQAAKALWRVAGTGMQAFIYDGALRGVHIDELMTECGVLVINKVHQQGQRRAHSGDQHDNDAGRRRWHTLGTWEHDTPDGRCTHQLAAVDGAVSEVGLDDAGRPVVLHRLVRRQVKRPRRSSGRFHFNVAYTVPCPGGDFLAWVTPHSVLGEQGHTRADAVRVIAAGEPDFDRLYPRRSDAESLNRAYKATLLIDRATSLGRARQLLDFLCFAVLHNARTSVVTAAAGRSRGAAA